MDFTHYDLCIIAKTADQTLSYETHEQERFYRFTSIGEGVVSLAVSCVL